MIKSILGGKSKNLFDISKVVTSNVVKRNGNSLICSVYGTSIGTLGSICPTLKPSDLITISFKCASEGAPSNFMAFGGRTFQSGATFLVSEIGLSTPWYLYSTDYEHRDIPNKTTYSDIQIELGSTATEYVPHELTSYKSIMKVSEVCQLLDKSKFYKTSVDYGVTWTNNGDGTITANGTATNIATYTLLVPNPRVIPGHKYLFISSITPQQAGVATVITNIGGESGNGFIFTTDLTHINIYFYVQTNITVSNVVFKPQLFDLTEMFGAGNEPKTVAEFKEKFPNEYYPYSPSCFVTSFDERMPCKTKNLFSSSTEVGVPSSTKFDRSEKRLMEDGKWYIGLAGSNYYSREEILDYSIIENSVYIKWRGNGYGVAKCIYCEPSTTYSFTEKYSLIQGHSLGINVGFYTEDGTFISFKGGTASPHFVFTTPENCKYITICLSGTKFPNDNFGAGCFSDLQLVKGTTATDYVPYGYV